MSFEDCYNSNKRILMEGALGERLKREYQLNFDKSVAMAGLIYSAKGKAAVSPFHQEKITFHQNNLNNRIHIPTFGNCLKLL